MQHRRGAWLCLLTALLLAGCTPADQSGNTARAVGLVTSSTGFPSVQRNSRPYILARQSTLFAGDVVTTDEQSLIDFTLGEDIDISLGTRSRLLITEYIPSGDSARVTLSLSSGSMEVAAASPGDRYEISTTHAVISTRANRYWIGYAPSLRELDVVALSGHPVKVKNRDGSVELRARLESSSVTAGAAPQESLRWTQAKFDDVRAASQRIERL